MRKYWIIGIGIAIILIIGAVFAQRRAQPKVDYTEFAQCLTANGVKMYGAYWCAHCKNQKEAFGVSFKEVRYIECGIVGNLRGQTEECKSAGITGYPTWEFTDGSRLRGEVPLEQLAEKSGCTMPPAGND